MMGEGDDNAEKPVVKKLSSSSSSSNPTNDSSRDADNGDIMSQAETISYGSIDNEEEQFDFPDADDNQGDPTPSWGDGVPHKIWFRVQSYR